MSREVDAHIVLVGPLGSGKRTLMTALERFAPPRGKITWNEAAHAAIQDGAIFFDFLPATPARLDSLPVRLHFYTVPDPEASPRALAFCVERASAIVFVADSSPARRDANIAALRLIDRTAVPIVFLFNKRDVSSAATIGELQHALDVVDASWCEGVATAGTGIQEVVRIALAAAMARHSAKPSR